jgi:ATP-dependent Lhr-like helicase
VLNRKLVDALGDRYSEFTPIQKLAFGPVLEGKNIVICSETGSGKTEAVMIPLFEKLSKNTSAGVKAVYMTPLRALNRDIHQRMYELAERLGIKIDVRHGDTPQGVRKKQIEHPPDILVTTPETFQAIITNNATLGLVSKVRHIVIDEANELVQSKRGVQLALALERFRILTASDPQLIFLSATIKSGGHILRFFNLKGTVVYLKSSKAKEIFIDLPRVNNSIRHIMEKAIQHARKKSIIFVNTRHLAETLAHLSADTGPGAEVHHSSLSVGERLRVEKSLKTNSVKHVIATSSLELGIDVGELEQVLQVGSPRSVETLLQRLGRSGHALSKKSSGWIIAMNPIDLLEAASISRLLESGWLEEPTLFKTPLDVLSNQIVGHLLARREATLEELSALPRACLCYSGFGEQDMQELLDFLNKMRFIRRLGTDRFIPGRRAKEFFYANITMIPTEKQFAVRDMFTKSTVGFLDSTFVEKGCETGGTIVLGRKRWEVLSVDYGVRVVNVKPSTESVAAVPSWTGETIPVSHYVAGRMVDILRARDHTKGLWGINLTEDARKALLSIPRVSHLSHNTVYVVPLDRPYLMVFAFLGTKANRALAAVIEQVARGYGYSATTRVMSMGVLVKSEASAQALSEALNALSPDEVFQHIIEGALQYGKYSDRLFSISKRLGFDVEHMIEKFGPRRTHLILCETYARKELLNELTSDVLDAKSLLTALSRGARVASDNEFRDFAKIVAASLAGDYEPQSASSLVDAVKARIESKKYYLHCLSCFRYSERIILRDLKEGYRCPKCSSAYLGFLGYSDGSTTKVLRALERDEHIPRELSPIKKELTQSADMYLSYGKRALIVLAGFGVGPVTAKRILRKRIVDEAEMYSEILKAEEQYIKTKEFWK